MRRAVLSRLFEHLQEKYNLDWSRDLFVDGQLAGHQIEAALAFKSDSHLDELRSALYRLDEGTYGICIHCKRPIEQEALDADPAQRLCPDCTRTCSYTGAKRYESHIHA